MTRLLDTMLVCAVATILIVRTQLWLTNYPQLGGRGLHIAHLLWGGLLMLVALVILLGFVSPSARQVAAVVGGVGLGLFTDELGKFVTADTTTSSSRPPRSSTAFSSSSFWPSGVWTRGGDSRSASTSST
jgi:hypothetical protein